MAERQLTQEYVRSLFHYDPETGGFRWRPRPIRDDKGQWDELWNARYAGQIAGYVSKHGYTVIGVNNSQYYAHRLAWLYVYGETPGEIDHKDRNRSNNSISNLRPATRLQNMQNKSIGRDNTSGIKGVHLHKPNGKWCARISRNGKRHVLGYFDDIRDAAASYRRASLEIYGEFAHPSE